MALQGLWVVFKDVEYSDCIQTVSMALQGLWVVVKDVEFQTVVGGSTGSVGSV